ncbi:LptF/LptG family permease [Acaryochloris sp. IP29b_bin.137]|uniref:LptF/LptG family permease n=1 Tax=Acaryochloris sp. IP29b_bin.137 TaxID=2969217 RepID=UPI00261B2DDB|nr:LptF/LptG family permease [Acaryochloris sp. IP29b_bin.137]
MHRWNWRSGPAIARIDRYLLKALLPPFLWGIGAFSSIGLAAAVLFDLLRQVSDAQLPLAIALTVLGLQIPYFVSLSIPMSVLLACLLAFSKLNMDGELMALQAVGMGLERLTRTSLCFSLVALILMFGLTEGVVPISQYQAQTLLVQTVQQGQLSLKKQHIIYPDKSPQNKLRRLVYAQSSTGQTLYGITMIDFTIPARQKVITAHSATWDMEDQRWIFQQGTIYFATADGREPHLIHFKTQQLQLSAAASPAEIVLNPMVMSLPMALQTLTQLRQTDAPFPMRILAIQIHRKIALPFTILAFGLVGSALGMQPQQSSANKGFGLSLIIILGQYILIFTAEIWSKTGLISPWLGAWLPTLVTGCLGIALLLPVLGLSRSNFSQQ